MRSHRGAAHGGSSPSMRTSTCATANPTDRPSAASSPTVSTRVASCRSGSPTSPTPPRTRVAPPTPASPSSPSTRCAAAGSTRSWRTPCASPVRPKRPPRPSPPPPQRTRPWSTPPPRPPTPRPRRRGRAEAEVEVEVDTRAADAAAPPAPAGGIHLDIDVDVCDRAVAPGCPASVPGGLAAWELRALVRGLARDPGVTSADIVEVDATADTDDARTVRLAALCVLELLAGMAERR